MLRITLVLVALALAGPAAAQTRSLVHDGETRRFIVEFPDTAGPAPALMVLHGGGGRARQIRRHTEFALAERGFVEIYPDAIDRQWNDGRTGRDGRALRSGDDLGFLLAVIDSLAAEGRVDPSRVYVTGISNGGAMAQRLVCQAPGRFAGAAVVAMNLPVGLDCPPGPPGPPAAMLFILGDADTLVPYGGGPITVGRRDRGSVRSAAITFEFWAARNHCGAPREKLLPDRDPDDAIRVRLTEWAGCAAPLAALVAEGGGHTWPGARVGPVMRAIVGPVAWDISATAEISAFFEALAAR